MAKNFKIGDLVWAKMKGYPPWPGEIMEPPSKSTPSKGKKPQHYVLFYGSDNHAWIADENILEHNQKLVEEHGTKKKIPTFQKAVETIMEKSKNISSAESEGAASPKFKNPENVLDTSLESANSSSEGKKRKSSKSRESKKHAYSPDISESESASLAERATRYEDVYKDLINNIPPNSDIDLNVCAPYSSSTSSSILARRYVERPDTPPLDLLEESAELLAKKIKATRQKIGFLGLGKLGQVIVKNLQHSGHTVIIWNRSTEKCIPFVEKLNVTVASTPADVVVAADITFCCVSDANAAKTLVFGNCGVIEGLQSCPSDSKKGYVEMTTMDANSSREIAEKIEAAGGRYLEAPLKGSRIDANNANLYIQTAGDKSLYDDCKTCFDAISQKHKYLNADVGCAFQIHAVYSMFKGTVYCSLAETLALSLRTNVDVSELLEILNIGKVEKNLVVQKCRAMINNNYATQTPLKHIQKDMGLGLLMGSSLEQPTPVVASANEVYKHCKILRYGDHDVSAIFEGTKP